MRFQARSSKPVPDGLSMVGFRLQTFHTTVGLIRPYSSVSESCSVLEAKFWEPQAPKPNTPSCFVAAPYTNRSQARHIKVMRFTLYGFSGRTLVSQSHFYS